MRKEVKDKILEEVSGGKVIHYGGKSSYEENKNKGNKDKKDNN